MNFILGYIAGIVTAALVFVILAYFRSTVERVAKIVDTKIQMIAPKPRGAIFLPEDESEVVRKQRIADNNKKGVDTPIDELR